MNRRTYLALAGSTVIAGCSGTETESITTTADGSTEQSSGDTTTTSSQSSTPTTTTESPTPTTTKTTTTSGEIDVGIESHELKKQQNDYTTDIYVLAKVVNEGDAPTGQVQLTARFYDENDSLLESTDGYLISLGGGETWRAAVPYIGTDGGKVAKHEVEGTFSEDAPEWRAEDIELLGSKLEKNDSGDAVVTGRAKNNRDEKVSYLQASVKFYADEQTVIGSEYTNVTDLPAGDKWRFKTTYFSAYQGESELIKNHTAYLTTDAL